MRLRKSVRSASGTLTWNGRIAADSATFASFVVVITASFAARSRLRLDMAQRQAVRHHEVGAINEI
jgi:hypothetical protein